MTLRGELIGHNGWVTQVCTNPQFEDMLVSSSRDKSIIVWSLNRDQSHDGVSRGFPRQRLSGHCHFVSDVVISSCGQFAVSASWDKTLRLWDLEKGVTTTVFEGHKNDVLSVAFSADNRQIISAGRDKTIKLWNTLGELKWTQEGKNSHNEWVSTVRFSPTTQNPVIVSGGWDKVVKVWHLSNFSLKSNFAGELGHKGYINSVTVSPDGSLAASGGADGVAKLWDLGETTNNPLHSLEGQEEISTLIFSPNRYWLCAACGTKIKIWDLEQKKLVEELSYSTANSEQGKEGKCISLAWSMNGQTLYAGYTDHIIRIWELQTQNDM